MIGSKGIRRFHTPDLTQFPQRTKGCATAGAPFIFIHYFQSDWK
jgi:hypothetical protein